MKKIILIILALVFMASLSFAATLNLKATWTANTETDMASYKLYRTDGTRTLIGTIPHPTIQYTFTQTVVDGSQGTMNFVLTAIDTAGNESVDSNTAPFSWDLKSPAAPGSLGISKQ